MVALISLISRYLALLLRPVICWFKFYLVLVSLVYDRGEGVDSIEFYVFYCQAPRYIEIELWRFHIHDWSPFVFISSVRDFCFFYRISLRLGKLLRLIQKFVIPFLLASWVSVVLPIYALGRKLLNFILILNIYECVSHGLITVEWSDGQIHVVWHRILGPQTINLADRIEAFLLNWFLNRLSTLEKVMITSREPNCSFYLRIMFAFLVHLVHCLLYEKVLPFLLESFDVRYLFLVNIRKVDFLAVHNKVCYQSCVAVLVISLKVVQISASILVLTRCKSALTLTTQFNLLFWCFYLLFCHDCIKTLVTIIDLTFLAVWNPIDMLDLLISFLTEISHTSLFSIHLIEHMVILTQNARILTIT